MILGVPTLHRYDLLDALISSAEHGSSRPTMYIIVDNGGGYSVERLRLRVSKDVPAILISPGKNLGVSASWNKIWDTSGSEPLVISNDDVVLGEKTIESFEVALKELPFVTSEAVGFALFGVTKECRDVVGSFDEAFWPAYFEDIDYHRRIMLSGIRNGSVPAPRFHGVSSTRDSLPPSEAKYIHDGFLKNRDYYARKWGGPQGSETFVTPFGGNDGSSSAASIL